MKKSIIFSFLMAIFAIAITSCSSSQDELKKACEEATKQCPVQADYGMSIVSIDYADNNVVYNVEVDEAIYGADAIQQFNAAKDQMSDAMKQAILSGSDKDIAAMVELCRKANANIIFKYTGKPSGQSMEIEIPANEL